MYTAALESLVSGSFLGDNIDRPIGRKLGTPNSSGSSPVSIFLSLVLFARGGGGGDTVMMRCTRLLFGVKNSSEGVASIVQYNEEDDWVSSGFMVKGFCAIITVLAMDGGDEDT